MTGRKDKKGFTADGMELQPGTMVLSANIWQAGSFRDKSWNKT